MSSISSAQYLDAAAEQYSGSIMEFFTKLNGAATEQTFEETSAMLEKFDAFRSAIENSVRRKTAAWLRARNSFATIHKLPTELLQLILRVALFSSSGRRRPDYVAKLTVLRSVSWMWRDLIERTPSFWTQLSSRDHIDFVSDALSKSQNCALHLKYVGELGNNKPSPFLDKVFTQLDRWEHVTIQDPCRVFIEKYFISPAPRLKGLALLTHMGLILAYGLPAPPVVFGGEWAGLEELRAIRWESIHWTNLNCHKLRVLEIEGHDPLDMEKLFSVLAQNLDLRILRLHDVKFGRCTSPLPNPKPLTLKSLTDLSISHLSETVGEVVPAACRILQYVHIPTCTSFSAEINLNDTSGITPADIFRLIPRPIDIFTRAETARISSSKSPTACVHIGTRSFECEAFVKSKSDPKYQLLLRGVPPNVSVEWVRRELVNARTETTNPRIKLRGWVDGNKLKVDHLFDLHDAENVVELDLIGGNAQRVEGVGRRLESPVTSPSGALLGPFLGLKTLRLSNCAITGREILQMMNERFVRIMNPLDMAAQNTTDGTASIPTENGVTIILGEGTDRLSRSMASEIRAAPGVRELKLYSKSATAVHGPAPDSSDESD